MPDSMPQSAERKPWWKIYTPRNVYLESIYRLSRLRRSLHFPSRQRDGDVNFYDDTHARRVGSFYDAYHDQFMQVYGSVIQAFRTKDVRHLLDYQMSGMNLQPGQKLLDAGCGVGIPALYFAKHAGVRVDAVTISQKQYEAALKNVAAEGLTSQVRITHGDYHRLPEYFEAGSYDVVYFLESFGHSWAKKYLLDVCWTMLKPGGLLYIKDLFKKIPLSRAHKKKIAEEVRKINEAYQYDIADLNTVLDHVRRKGYILSSLRTIDLNLREFENLTISNEFQELTKIARIEDWGEYVFPVEFYELKLIKPDYDLHERPDRYHLQQLQQLYSKQAEIDDRQIDEPSIGSATSEQELQGSSS